MEGLQRPPPSKIGCLKCVVPFALLVLVGVGLVVLIPETGGLWIVVVAPLLIILALRLPDDPPRLLVVAGVFLGALIVPVLALLGTDALWFGSGTIDPLLGLGAGALVVGLATSVYLRPWWVREPAKKALLVAGGLVLAFVVAPPFIVGAIAFFKGDETALEERLPAVSRLEVVVLRPDTNAPEPGATDDAGWAIATSVGQVTGEGVQWDEKGAPPLIPEADADRVLLLMVDGGQPGSALPESPGSMRRSGFRVTYRRVGVRPQA